MIATPAAHLTHPVLEDFGVRPFDSRTIPATIQIDALVAGVPGWSPLDQLCALYQLGLCTAHLPGDTVEIGSWCGRSALVLGSSARATGSSRVHCVDYFPNRDDWSQNSDGSYSFSVFIEGRSYGGHREQTVWKEPFERDIVPVYEHNPSLWDLFLENVRRNKLHETIVPLRGDSDIFVRSVDPAFQCRLAFIDGGHDYDSVARDIDNLTPFLVPGGWICFDDAFSTYKGVDRAIEDRVLASPQFDLGQQLTRKFFAARRKA